MSIRENICERELDVDETTALWRSSSTSVMMRVRGMPALICISPSIASFISASILPVMPCCMKDAWNSSSSLSISHCCTCALVHVL